MPRYDRLITFLESEKQVLQQRIAGLRKRDVLVGVDTGEGGDSPVEESLETAESRLAEIEEHLAELRADSA